jgi:hypothetical protein
MWDRFDGVYDEHTTSKEVFEEEISQMILPVFEGYNTTIFAYGITGSGKTHSMVGIPSEPGILSIPSLSLSLFLHNTWRKEHAQRMERAHVVSLCRVARSIRHDMQLCVVQV